MMKTCVVKLYNLSNHKKTVIEKAFQQYTLAYSKLLRIAEQNIEEIKATCIYNGEISTKNVAQYLQKHVSGHMHSSVKDSLILDAAAALTSYIKLKEIDENTSFPSCRNFRDKEQRYVNALYEFCSSMNLEEENAAKDKMTASLKESYMPIYFARADGTTRNRNFGILYDMKSNRYYVSLYLMHKESKHKKPVLKKGEKSLSEIHKNGSSLKESSRPVSYILCPLEFGKYQEEYLKKALEDATVIRTAFLSKKEGEYFLHITFDIAKTKEKIKPETVMGIDRGVNKLIAYTVTGTEGKVVEQGSYSGKEYEELQENLSKLQQELQKKGKNSLKRYSKSNEAYIHILANFIVDIALKYKSQVVLEDLTGLSKGGFRAKTGNKYIDRLMNRKLGRNPYNKLKQILDYKLPDAELPKAKAVKAAGTSIFCPRCGCYNKENRASQEEFKCIECGHEMNADLNASWNISKRWINIKNKYSEKLSTGGNVKTA